MAKKESILYEHPMTKYSKLAEERRGLIINMTINLENIIDFRIARYYAKDEATAYEMAEMVISGLTFHNKITTLIWLLEKYDKEIFITWPTIKRHLNKIKDNRNKMAHSPIDSTVTFLANRAKFKPHVTNLKSRGETHLYDEKRVKALSNMILKYSHIIHNW